MNVFREKETKRDGRGYKRESYYTYYTNCRVFIDKTACVVTFRVTTHFRSYYTFPRNLGGLGDYED